MPYLLADDAAEQAGQQLQDFARQQLANLGSFGSGVVGQAQSAVGGLAGQAGGLIQPQLPQLPQLDAAAITQQLQDFAAARLQEIQEQQQRAQQEQQQLQQQLLDEEHRRRVQAMQDAWDERTRGFLTSDGSLPTPSLQTTGQGGDTGGFYAPITQFAQGALDQLEQQRQQRVEQPSVLDLLDSAVHAAWQGEPSEAAGSVAGLAGRLFDDLGTSYQTAPERYPNLFANNPSLDLTRPLGPQLGIDPYGAIVQHGVPQILQGLGERDPGAVAGGALQTLLGAASALPGTGGGALTAAGRAAEQIAPRVAEEAAQAAAPLVRDAVPAISRTAARLSSGDVARSVAEELANRTATAGADVRPPAPPPDSAERLDWLLDRGRWAPPEPDAPPTLGRRVADWISSGYLSGPGLLWNVASASGNLAWQPMQRLLEGHPVEAADAVRAMIAAAPDALAAARQVALEGKPYLGVRAADAASDLGAEGRSIAPYLVGIRGNLTGDALMRVLNERMGGVLEAQRLLREAKVTTPEQARALLAQQGDQIAQAAEKQGLASAFLSPGQKGTPASQAISRAKNALLDDPNPWKQLGGVILHTIVPFPRIPEAIVLKTLRNTPVVGQALDLYRIVKPAAGDTRQQSMVKAGMNAAIAANIVKGVLDGNIASPDDPLHPGMVQLAGHWIPYAGLGVVGGQMSLTSAAMDAFSKEGYQAQPSLGHALEQALGKAGQAVERDLPYADLLTLFQMLGRGQVSQAATRVGSDLVGGLVPVSSLLGAVETGIDPHVRDVERSGPSGLVEPALARIPGLAQLLPEQINPLTGEPQLRQRTGLEGAVLRSETQPADPLTAAILRLRGRGYPINVPQPDDTVTIGGSTIKLSPAEQRAMLRITGGWLGNLTQMVTDPTWSRTDEATQARVLERYLDAAQRVRVAAAVQVIPADQLGDRIARGARDIGGRPLSSGANLIQEFQTLIDPNSNASVARANLVAQLQQAIADARQRGDTEGARQLQQQLDQLRRPEPAQTTG